MGKLKDLAMEICELYDEQGLTIMEIVEATGQTEDFVIEALSNFSETFGVV